MASEYVQIINDFKPFAAAMPEGKIDTDKIDMFLSQLTDVYVSILDNGYKFVENENLPFVNKSTKEFFIAGMSGVRQALVSRVLEVILSFLFSQAGREHSITAQELLEIDLLKNIIPFLRPESECIIRFIDFLGEFCSSNNQHFQIAKFTKFIDIYKLRDCYILNAINAL
ncbi:MAG: hypothetical protein LBU18_06555 [Treponema sp.]|jgi:hypothetical protein|nr:hypothetical protein [Treponema sp.]